MRQIVSSTRKERRAVTKRYGLPYRPRYAKGFEPKTHLEMFGEGYERFDSKYVKVSDKVTNREAE